MAPVLRRRASRRPRPPAPGLLQRWLVPRLRASETHTLTPRRIYILPSAAGWGFAVALLVLLVTSINYQLNLGYALTFLLASTGMASAWVAQRTLQGLEIGLLPPQPVFAREIHALRLSVNNPTARDRHAVQLRWLPLPRGRRRGPQLPADPHPAVLDCAALERSDAELPLSFVRRGLSPLPVLEIATEFPLGLFRAWSWWQPAQTQWVWPRVDTGAPDLRDLDWTSDSFDSRPQRARPHSDPTQRSDIPDDYRAWRSGDALRRVVWRKVAKAGMDRPAQWVTRDTSSEEAAGDLTAVWLDPALCAGLPRERQLGRLAAWALQAEDLGIPYAVRGLPAFDDGASSLLGHGPAQVHRVLCHLAQA
ncbi:DUF58 domain-containing protein [Amphibiibacter pelophylacis]|uniref:DUF58 domain-containing protein n=1 Tax=Amphibiibacter pelophylacis TaxID=1799477 RepID=A0ACC6P4A6_9BURK